MKIDINWIRMINIVLLMAITSLLTEACQPKQPEVGSAIEGLPSDVYRFIDQDTGVVCYTFNFAGLFGGISCLPLDQTRLRE